MKILEKTVTLGEMNFKIGVDRNISVNVFEAYPDVLEYLINSAQEINDSNKDKNINETQFLLNAIKNKKLDRIFEIEDKMGDLVAYALPQMLRKVGDTTDASKIIEYAKENGADVEFNSAILSLLNEAFTQRELGKPKIKFSMK